MLYNPHTYIYHNPFNLKLIITCLVVCPTQCFVLYVGGKVNSRGWLSVCGGKSWQLRTRLINAKRKHAYKLCALRREFISMNAANKLRVLTLIIRPVCAQQQQQQHKVTTVQCRRRRRRLWRACSVLN